MIDLGSLFQPMFISLVQVGECQPVAVHIMANVRWTLELSTYHALLSTLLVTKRKESHSFVTN